VQIEACQAEFGVAARHTHTICRSFIAEIAFWPIGAKVQALELVFDISFLRFGIFVAIASSLSLLFLPIFVDFFAMI